MYSRKTVRQPLVSLTKLKKQRKLNKFRFSLKIYNITYKLTNYSVYYFKKKKKVNVVQWNKQFKGYCGEFCWQYSMYSLLTVKYCIISLTGNSITCCNVLLKYDCHYVWCRCREKSAQASKLHNKNSQWEHIRNIGWHDHVLCDAVDAVNLRRTAVWSWEG